MPCDQSCQYCHPKPWGIIDAAMAEKRKAKKMSYVKVPCYRCKEHGQFYQVTEMMVEPSLQPCPRCQGQGFIKCEVEYEPGENDPPLYAYNDADNTIKPFTPKPEEDEE